MPAKRHELDKNCCKDEQTCPIVKSYSSTSSPECLGAPPKKRWHKKVRTGCGTCRARKLKCDEQKPFCIRCLHTGRQCEGYTTPPPVKYGARRSKYSCDPFLIYDGAKLRREPRQFSAKYYDLNAVSSWSSRDPHELRAFRYFIVHAGRKISGYFDADFWNIFVPQTSHVEAAVWHAVLSLSSLQELAELPSNVNHGLDMDKQLAIQDCARYQFAVQQYNKSVSILATDPGLSGSNAINVLTCCLIFIWIELIRDNFISAFAHTLSGLRILAETRVQKSEVVQLRQHFRRIYTQFMVHGGPGGSPVAHYAREIRLHTLVDEPCQTISDVHNRYYTILLAVLNFHRHLEQPSLRLKLDRVAKQAHVQAFVTDLLRWKQDYDKCTAEKLSGGTDKVLNTSLMQLELLYLFTLNTLETLDPATPMVFDSHYQTYRRIVDLCGELIKARADTSNSDGSRCRPRLYTFPLGTSTMSVLFYVTLKCREYSTRHAALDLIRQCPLYEGAWSRQSVLDYAEWKVAFEEGLAIELGQGWNTLVDGYSSRADIFIPEAARIWAEKTIKDEGEGGKRILSYRRGSEAMGIMEEADITHLRTWGRLKGLLGCGRNEQRLMRTT